MSKNGVGSLLSVFFENDFDYIHDGYGYPIGEKELEKVAEFYRKTKELIKNKSELNNVIKKIDAEHRAYHEELRQYHKERSERPTFVYLAKDTIRGFIKIGFSINVKGRIQQLKIANPGLEHLMSFNGTYDDEQALHSHFNTIGKRVDSEWYSLAAPDIEYIKSYFNQNMANR